jgi:RNA polymerase sigma-70 factor, ECF subfamily
VAKSQQSAKSERPDDLWAEWLKKAALGDQHALSALYDASSRLVYGLVLRIVGDAATAEDVTLDVYLQVWNQAARFDPERGRVVTWLTTIARSRAIDRLRASPTELLLAEPLDIVDELEKGDSNPEASAVLEQRRTHVRKALETLSPEQRRALELAFFGGLSQNEIALKLNEPLGTVKTRIRSGMIKLRDALRQYEEDFA